MFASITDAAGAIRDGQITPIELTEHVLDIIDKHDEHYGAYVEVLADAARAEARERTEQLAGHSTRGPLHGIPIAIKDLIDVKGAHTTGCSDVLAGQLAHEDAVCVQRLRAAGAVIIGKTTTHEFAFGCICPPTRNAWSAEHISGGSSGGSAVAVATEMALAAIGTDTGGSVRCPAAFNGVVGLKPTYGRIPAHGVIPLSWSLDHVGTLTRTVGDAALLLEAMAGRDSRDPASSIRPVEHWAASRDTDLSGVRIGVAPAYFQDMIDPAVDEIFEAAVGRLVDLGAELVEVVLDGFDLLTETQMGILLPEASAYHRDHLRSAGERYGSDVRSFLELGEVIPATHYVNAQRHRQRLKLVMQGCFNDAGIAALVSPTLPTTAPVAGQDTLRFPDGREVGVMTPLLTTLAPANITGQPALSVPCGSGDSGLPVGLSILGRPFDEKTVLRIGASFEGATEHHLRRPDLVVSDG